MPFKGLYRRGNGWTLRKRVPGRFLQVAYCKEVWKSLESETRSRAEKEAEKHWQELLRHWETLTFYRTRSNSAHGTFLENKEVSRHHGFRYISADKVSKLPLRELVDRINAAHPNGGFEADMRLAHIFQGTGATPELPLSEVIEFFVALSRDNKRNRSEGQWERYLAPKKRALKKFIAYAGDMKFTHIDQDILIDYRAELYREGERKNLAHSTISSNFYHLSSVLKKIQRSGMLETDFDTSVLQIRRGEIPQRPPFSTRWIKEQILKSHHLSTLRPDIKCLLLALINTGLRVSEATKLRAEVIRLGGQIPFVDINENGQRLKTRNAIRQVPLAGVSLDAFRQFPNGFIDVKADPYASNTLNLFLTKSGLREPPKHTLHSFRHSLADRLIEVRTDPQTRAAILGHKFARTQYGIGGSLEHKFDAIQNAAL